MNYNLAHCFLGVCNFVSLWREWHRRGVWKQVT